ncbi:peroxiredoxin [Pseudodonghicola flavimaris]|uniref:thioredoxin-dependent peroxiredoxin n=1 Tax=Pseudodonghicola flavimaris TaxID=3050036 RepID=A0ABT7EVQ5_9RHOB|nr:peroxiredoxin [Pseudodonghicola flavimaris]MDK3016398.1 peroxiredoxin [Pseudodonghicola flavimaris]
MPDQSPVLSDTAPDFTLPRDGGGEVSLSGLRGSLVVLYFYPRDDTPGCTKESIGFSEQLQAFADAGAQVFGISRDTVAKHDKFVAKHGLTVPLLSDEDGKVCEAYGVWVEKNMYGRKSMGIERSTFVIDTEGKIAGLWRKVKVPGHVEAVLDTVKELAG